MEHSSKKSLGFLPSVIFIVCVSSCFVWAISFDYVLWILVLLKHWLWTKYSTCNQFHYFYSFKTKYYSLISNHFLSEISSPRIKNSEVKNLRFCTALALHFFFVMNFFVWPKNILSFEKNILNVFFCSKVLTRSKVIEFVIWMSSKSF